MVEYLDYRMKCATYPRSQYLACGRLTDLGVMGVRVATDLSVMGVRVSVANFFFGSIDRCKLFFCHSIGINRPIHFS